MKIFLIGLLPTCEMKNQMFRFKKPFRKAMTISKLCSQVKYNGRYLNLEITVLPNSYRIYSNDQIWKSKFGDDSIEFWEETSQNDPTFWKKEKLQKGKQQVEIELKFAIWEILSKIQEETN